MAGNNVVLGAVVLARHYSKDTNSFQFTKKKKPQDLLVRFLSIPALFCSIPETQKAKREFPQVLNSSKSVKKPIHEPPRSMRESGRAVHGAETPPVPTGYLYGALRGAEYKALTVNKDGRYEASPLVAGCSTHHKSLFIHVSRWAMGQTHISYIPVSPQTVILASSFDDFFQVSDQFGFI